MNRVLASFWVRATPLWAEGLRTLAYLCQIYHGYMNKPRVPLNSVLLSDEVGRVPAPAAVSCSYSIIPVFFPWVKMGVY